MNESQKAYASALQRQFDVGNVHAAAQRELAAAEEAERNATRGFWNKGTQQMSEVMHESRRRVVRAREAEAAARQAHEEAKAKATELAARCPLGLPKPRTRSPWRGRRTVGM